jgi:hypothetical protein
MRHIHAFTIAAARCSGRSARDEERVAACEQCARRRRQARAFRADRAGRLEQRGVERRFACLNVLLAVAEALLDLHAEGVRVARAHATIGAIPAPRFELNAEQAQCRALAQVPGQRIAGHGLRGHDERSGRRRAHKAGRARQNARPEPARIIHAAEHEQRQGLEQLAVLVGHFIANPVATSALDLLAHPEVRLHPLLAGVKRRGGVRPAGRHALAAPHRDGHDFASLRAMATKPGNASMRASQARIAGYSASDTSPSGACAVYE